MHPVPRAVWLTRATERSTKARLRTAQLERAVKTEMAKMPRGRNQMYRLN